MRFKENQLTPEAYKGAFLHFIDTLAPEVMDRMKSLLPAYEQLTDGMSSDQVKSVFDCVVTNEPEYINETLFCFDENFRFCADEIPELNENQKTILKKLLDFRQTFLDFIKQFGLERAWLKMHIFDTIVLQANNPHLPVKFSWRGYAWWIYRGDPITFSLDGWRVCEIDSDTYAKEAIAAFKEHLDNYIHKTAVNAKTRGYTTRGRPNDFDRVKWLVRWTVQNKKMREIADEFFIAERAVWDAFETFKKHDLPVRTKNKTEVI